MTPHRPFLRAAVILPILIFIATNTAYLSFILNSAPGDIDTSADFLLRVFVLSPYLWANLCNVGITCLVLDRVDALLRGRTALFKACVLLPLALTVYAALWASFGLIIPDDMSYIFAAPLHATLLLVATLLLTFFRPRVFYVAAVLYFLWSLFGLLVPVIVRVNSQESPGHPLQEPSSIDAAVADCLDVYGNVAQFRCITDVAVRTSDPSICDLIQEPTLNDQCVAAVNP